MNRKLKLLGLIALTAFIVLSFTACDESSNSENKPAELLGKWGINDAVLYRFTSTKFYVTGTGNFTYNDWRAIGTVIDVKYAGNWQGFASSWSVSDNKLKITILGMPEITLDKIN